MASTYTMVIETIKRINDLLRYFVEYKERTEEKKRKQRKKGECWRKTIEVWVENKKPKIGLIKEQPKN